MILATYALCLMAAVLFAIRLMKGPSLADRVLGLNGLLLVGMGTVAATAINTGSGAFLPALIALALVGPISNGMIARYIEGIAQE